MKKLLLLPIFIAVIFALVACDSAPAADQQLSIELRLTSDANNIAGGTTSATQGDQLTFIPTLRRGDEAVENATFTWSLPTNTQRNPNLAPVPGTTVVDGIVTISPNQPIGNLRLNVTATLTGRNVATSVNINVHQLTVVLAELFPDLNLAQVVARALGVSVIEPIESSRLTSLNFLDASNTRISDLTGISSLRNLEVLLLNNNGINNLEPGIFNGLTNLEMLTLNNNQINKLELGTFAGLTNLEMLTLNNNHLNHLELGAFNDLANLATLWLDSNEISQLEPEIFTDLTSLAELDLGNNQIDNLDSLVALPNLAWLGLSGNQIKSLKPLTALASLTTLGLSSNQIENLAPLAELTELAWLNLGNNRIDKLNPLASLTNLATLGLSWNQVENLAPLAKLTELADLRLNNNQISDLRPLAKLNLSRLNVQNQTIQLPAITVGQATQLELFHRNSDAVKLHGTGFTFVGQNLVWNVAGERSATWSADILDLGDFSGTVHQSVVGDSPVEPEPSVVRLVDVFECEYFAWVVADHLWWQAGIEVGIEDELELVILENITWLEVSWHNVQSISGIEHLVNLIELWLENTQVSDLLTLNLPNLELLGLWDNQISDLTSLTYSNLPQLRGLHIGSNQINDFPILDLPNLEWLEIWGTQISDLTPLTTSNLPQLRELYLGNNQISDLRPLAGLELLQVSAGNQTVHLPATSVGEATEFNLFTPNEETINLSSWNSEFTFENQSLTWHTAGANLASWDGWLDNGWFSGTVHQSVIGDSPVEPEPSPEELTMELTLSGEAITSDPILAYRGTQLEFEAVLRSGDEVIENAEFNWSFEDGIFWNQMQTPNGSTVAEGVVTVSATEQTTTPIRLNVESRVGDASAHVYISAVPRIVRLVDIFECENLAWVVVEQLSWQHGVTDIEDEIELAILQSISQLWASWRNIQSLSGIEYLTNVTSLSLGSNAISDLTPLTTLTNLISLELSSNQITNLEPLSDLTRLTSLSLGSNTISDLAPLTNLTNLTTLGLWSNQIIGLSPLTGLVNLTGLELGSNEISDITPLASLPNLTSLGLGSNAISNLIPLTSLANLTTLNLWSNRITNLEPLTSLTSLNSLDLWSNQIINIEPLSSLTNLTSLWLNNNQIVNVEPIMELARLVSLGLGSNQINNVAPLSSLTSLATLDLWNNQISVLNPLASLTNLSWLDLGSNQISDLSPLAGLMNLTGLELGSNEISDITPLVSLTNLTSLGLGNNAIIDFIPLTSLTNLTWLSLWNNQISDLSFLSDLTSLTGLDLGSNQISDLIPLAPLTNLMTLSLGGNLISDLVPLTNLTNLTSLSLWNNQISDLRPLDELDLSNLSVGGQVIQLPETTVGVSTLLEIFLPDGTVIDSLTHTGWGGEFTFENNHLTWHTTSDNNTASWSQAHGIGWSPVFSGSIHQAVTELPSNLVRLSNIFECENLAWAVAEQLQLYFGISWDIEDEFELAFLEEITELWASEQSIQSLSGIEYLTNVASLWLSSNEISDLTPLASLANLTTLDLSGNQISNIAPITSLLSLGTLVLDDNQIDDLNALGTANLPNLGILHLGNNQIEDLNPLEIANLPNLGELALWNNQISDLRPLTGLELYWLSVSDQTIYLPETNAGEATEFNLFLPAPNENDVALMQSNGEFTFENQYLTWHTAGDNVASWDGEFNNGNAEFSGTVHQSVSIGDLPTELLTIELMLAGTGNNLAGNAILANRGNELVFVPTLRRGDTVITTSMPNFTWSFENALGNPMQTPNGSTVNTNGVVTISPTEQTTTLIRLNVDVTIEGENGSAYVDIDVVLPLTIPITAHETFTDPETGTEWRVLLPATADNGGRALIITEYVHLPNTQYHNNNGFTPFQVSNARNSLNT